MNFYILALLYIAFFAFLSALIASFKNRNVTQWFWIGVLGGIFSVIILLTRPNIKEEPVETHTL